MQDTAKYLVHADITADGVVERSDVVGAVFGQTEGLLGDDLDLRELQDSSKVGRIDVEIDSQNGQSFGHITIATSLDQVETAILGAALETIDRVGPCRSTIEVRKIEDVRAAKRREVVERAKTLFGEAFDDSVRSSRDLVEEVREAVRVEDISEYEGLPAGPHVADSDAIVVVEGRADVLTLLRYGIKNAIAVEGTSVPDAVADLTESRTVTAFLDGDRGGELILKELEQVGDVDHVAFAPEGRSVEDLARHEVMTALREKVPYDRVAAADDPGDVVPSGVERPTDADPTTAAGDGAAAEPQPNDRPVKTDGASAQAATPDPESAAGPVDDAADDTVDDAPTMEEPSSTSTAAPEDDESDPESESADEPETLRGHVRAVVDGDAGTVRLLDAEFGVVASGHATDAFDLLADASADVTAVVLDAELDQRLLDVAAQRGVDQIVAASTGEFVKQPTSVRVRTADQLLATNEA
ncbi:DNA primase [Natronomonas salina]|uniref:DNA primase DnaG n=1 Tax=Natronomonas salina TaxID=1710540 RepID=UPI0015B3826B|nr:DNA primase DnaG [Natronomonas salina]QLD90664.1 DNA primase [Natronomonas salina]